MNSEKKYVLSLDQGTTSSRAIIFDKHGQIVCKAQHEFPQIYPKAGWVEHDPMMIIQSESRSITDAMIKGNIEASEIAAIGITNQRETTVLWDAETSEPVYNAIVWQCRRTADIAKQIMEDAELTEYIKEHTGLIVDAYFSGTKIKWILEHSEKARKLAEQGRLRFGTIDTWLIWRLTRGKAHVTDYSNAWRTMLYDVDNLCWDKHICDALGIPMDILPEVRPSSEVYGYVAEGIPGLEALAGTPVAAAIGDQQAALFGQGCFRPGQAKNTYGTGCFLVLNTGGTRIKSKNNLLTGLAWGIDGQVEYCMEGSAFNAGSVIQWLRDELQIIDNAPECDRFAESVPDSNGVYLVPAFTGLGAPYWDMYARGAIVGLTRGANKRHLCRAVLESIVYQMTDLLEAMKADSDIQFTELRVDGGASVSDIMMQIQANMIQTKVNRPKVVETTALGAAYLAGLATGVWDSRTELEGIREVSREFVPQMHPDERDALYKGWKRAVERSMHWVEE